MDNLTDNDDLLGAAPTDALVAPATPEDPLLTPELREQIITMVCNGLSQAEVLRQLNQTPYWLHKRLAVNPEFAEQYAEAKRIRAHNYADEMMDIADNATNDWMDRNDAENPGFQFMGEHVQRSKLRIETRRWVVARMLPKLYGDKIAIGGAEDLGPVKSTTEVTGHLTLSPSDAYMAMITGRLPAA